MSWAVQIVSKRNLPSTEIDFSAYDQLFKEWGGRGKDPAWAVAQGFTRPEVFHGEDFIDAFLQASGIELSSYGKEVLERAKQKFSLSRENEDYSLPSFGLSACARLLDAFLLELSEGIRNRNNLSGPFASVDVRAPKNQSSSAEVCNPSQPVEKEKQRLITRALKGLAGTWRRHRSLESQDVEDAHILSEPTAAFQDTQPLPEFQDTEPKRDDDSVDPQKPAGFGRPSAYTDLIREMPDFRTSDGARAVEELFQLEHGIKGTVGTFINSGVDNPSPDLSEGRRMMVDGARMVLAGSRPQLFTKISKAAGELHDQSLAYVQKYQPNIGAKNDSLLCDTANVAKGLQLLAAALAARMQHEAKEKAAASAQLGNSK